MKFYAISFEPNENVIHTFDSKKDREYWLDNQTMYTNPRICSRDEAIKVCKESANEYIPSNGVEQLINDEAVHHEIKDGIDYMSTLDGMRKWHVEF